MLDRRPLPRQAAGWTGTCLIEDEEGEAHGWRPCSVLDISPFGLGITLPECYGAEPEVLGRTMVVEFPAVSDWVSIRLEGAIKNTALVRPGVVRVGIEFLGLTEAEQAIATVLGVLTAIDEEWATTQARRPRTLAGPGGATGRTRTPVLSGAGGDPSPYLDAS